VSVLAALNAKTLELRKNRDPLAGSFQAVQALATANAKERAIKAKQDLSTVKADDEDALKAIQKSVKQVRDTLALKPDHAPSLRELEILEALLPKMASEQDVKDEATSFAETLPEKSMKQMGAIMAHLASTFGTSLDKAQASQIARQVLAA